jgi:hypothetical protein
MASRVPVPVHVPQNSSLLDTCVTGTSKFYTLYPFPAFLAVEMILYLEDIFLYNEQFFQLTGLCVLKLLLCEKENFVLSSNRFSYWV